MVRFLQITILAIAMFIMTAIPAFAIDARAGFAKRTAILAFASQCDLLNDAELLAIKSGQLQTRGALLRSGMSLSEVQNMNRIAKQSVAGIDCSNLEALAEIDRVKSSHTSWLAMGSQKYPGTYRAWDTRRNDASLERHWRAIQDIETTDTGSILIGSSVLDGKHSLDLVIENQSPPRSVLLRMRDPNKLQTPPNKFLRKLLKLPVDGVPGLAPPDSATNTYFATQRVIAEPNLLSSDKNVSGVRFGFGEDSLKAFSELDPREAISIDLYWSNGLGKPDRHQRLYAEVGDFLAARIFAEAKD